MIDLGVPEEPSAEPFRWSRSSLARRLRSGPPPDRRTATAVLVALVLATVAAAAPIRSPLVEVLSRALGLGGDFVVTADRLYITGPGLSAYQLPSGHPLWTAHPPVARGTTVMTVPGGDVILTAAAGRDLAEPYDYAEPLTGGRAWGATSAIDAATGRTRWTVPGLVRPLGAGGIAVVQGPRLAALDLATGRELWNTYAPGADFTALPGRPNAGALVRSDGRTELRDLRTGRVDRAARLLTAGQQVISPVRAVGGLLILPYWGPTDSGFVAYDDATLTPRWRRARAVGSELSSCGPLLCVRDAATMLAVDPATGATRGRVPARWSVTATDTIPGAAASAAAVLWRTADDGERGWLARLAPDGALRILESFPYRLSDCQLVTTAIACRAAPGDVRVWSFRK